jgi:hypothetical protein
MTITIAGLSGLAALALFVLYIIGGVQHHQDERSVTERRPNGAIGKRQTKTERSDMDESDGGAR